ncbi:ABC transporter permease [Martelella soudanensis]|uniref:ABC transporter permease n=1 Tax=unclassified Martelella TaxID=2629616 RepID=UPI0015E02FD3|nr:MULTISPECIES: ABC transporter permease [unclassified Martelella]
MWLLIRIASGLMVLLVVSATIFALTRLGGVSPALMALGADANQAQIATYEAQYGLDQPIVAQYLSWLAHLPTEGFATSFMTGQSVNERLLQTIPVSLELVVSAFALSVAGSVLLGSISAFWENRWPDHAIRIVCMAALSVPGFWLGLLLMRVFGVSLGWLPPVGLPPWPEGAGEHLAALIMPATAIAVYYIGAMSRLLRASFIDVLGQDYMRTARALGLPARMSYLYALKNALPPFVSMAAMSFGYMFGWAVIVEMVFNIPGVSRALLTAIFQRDYPMIQAIVVFVTLVFVIASTFSDVLQRQINPRLAN